MRWFPKRLRKNEAGSLSLEAMLTLPLFLIALFLCVGLIFTLRGALVLDQALGAVCRDMAESSYLLRQALGLGLDALESLGEVEEPPGARLMGEGAGAVAGGLWAKNCLDKYLEEYPEVGRAIEWQRVRVPVFAAETEGRPAWPDSAGEAAGNAGKAAGGAREAGGSAGIKDAVAGGIADAAAAFNEDDVVLILTLTPAKLNGITAMLPDSWQITFTKRQKAWLTGRNLLPDRGLEQGAGQKEKGPLIYITRWGIKYHREDCRYLAQSKIPVYLGRLSAAYDPCSVCRPPGRDEKAGY